MEPHGIGLTFPIDGRQQPQEYIEHRLVAVVIAASKTFVAEIVPFQQKMAEIQADAAIPAKDKKQMLDELAEALKSTPPLKYLENIAVVKKHREAIEKAMEDAGRGGRLRGASTISQQVAKNLFLWSGQNWFRKGLEAWFTVWIELLWPKQRILEVYLNVAQFGRGTWGVEAASQRYFGKSAAELTRHEAALLAAVLPSPTRYRVVNPGPYVRQRQQWILGQMNRLGGTRLLETL